jgi:hypothetical protein
MNQAKLKRGMLNSPAPAAAHPESIERWRAFAQEPHRPLADRVVDELIPLYGTREFGELSSGEKRRLYFYFIQWVAEFFIVLEGSLLIAFRTLPENAKAGRILEEERLHSRAFRRFLKNEKCLGYPGRQVFLHRHPIAQRILTAVFRRFPLSMTIPGAKIEAYSIAYGKLLKQVHGSADADTWTKLNWLHLLDEAHHVPFEFDLYNEEFAKLGLGGRLGSVAGIWVFYLFLQWILICGCFRMAWTSLEPSNFWRKLRLSAQTLYWASYEFQPSRHMRSVAMACYREKSPRWRRLIWFVCR